MRGYEYPCYACLALWSSSVARGPHKSQVDGSNPSSASMAGSVEYQRRYQLQRRIERLALARERLGGRCVRCGISDGLDFDHIVPGSKLRKISEATNWSLERFLTEVDKCQLLCRLCHIAKSAETGENGGVPHGGGKRGKRYCKCALCRAKNAEYMREYKRRKKMQTSNGDETTASLASSMRQFAEQAPPDLPPAPESAAWLTVDFLKGRLPSDDSQT